MTSDAPRPIASTGHVADSEPGRLGSLPGLRTFHSPRFRILLATIALLAGIVLNATRLAAFDTSEVSVVFDFRAYYFAAERMLAGSSPYLPAQLESGAGYCFDCYLYPPFFAQVLSPITLLPLESAKIAWVLITYLAAFTSTWLATGIGGAARSVERVLWCLAAALLFEAVASAAWVGNVGTIVGLGVMLTAMGGVAAGVGSGLAALIKVAPATLLPAVFFSGRQARISLMATLAIVTGTLFLLAPQAWLEYPAVLVNVFADPVVGEGNLAINSIAATMGWGVEGVPVIRLLMQLAGVACVLLSIWLARQQGGMPAAAVLGTAAMLIIPSSLWYHYLAVLLPIAAMAWPRADAVARCFLAIGMLLVTTMPYHEQPLVVTVGWVLSLGAAGWALWPRNGGRPMSADEGSPDRAREARADAGGLEVR